MSIRLPSVVKSTALGQPRTLHLRKALQGLAASGHPFRVSFRSRQKAKEIVYKPSYRIVISGSRFSPAAFVSRTGLELSDAEEPDSIASLGRNKGKPPGYGSAALSTRPELPEPQSIHELLARFEKHATDLRDQGAEEIYFDAAIYWKDQCNLAYDADVLLKMGQLGLNFWVSCYEDSDP